MTTKRSVRTCDPQKTCVHLHVHSEYSLVDGACKVDALVSRAAEFGQPALGLTDHGVMNGVVELHEACAKHGVKPISAADLLSPASSAPSIGRQAVLIATERGWR